MAFSSYKIAVERLNHAEHVALDSGKTHEEAWDFLLRTLAGGRIRIPYFNPYTRRWEWR